MALGIEVTNRGENPKYANYTATLKFRYLAIASIELTTDCKIVKVKLFKRYFASQIFTDYFCFNLIANYHSPPIA